MNWYKFIFSEEKPDRFRRHLVFWLLWWIYFTGTYFHYQQTGLKQIGFEKWNEPLFIKSVLLLLIHVIACYSFLNVFFTRYLLKKKYLAFTGGVIILSAALLFSSYVLHASVFPYIDKAFNYEFAIPTQSLWWTSISASLLSAPKVIAAAVAIKLVKRWYQKEKEKERLEKEKLTADLQLLKAQIHPEFLFTSLEKISAYALQKDTVKASAYLLKLSELLSYTLYECDNRLVPLGKEINIITGYMALQKASMDNRLELDISITGEAGHEMITPLLLLPFIENSFSYCNDKSLETCWLNVELKMEHHELMLKLIHGKASEPAGMAANENLIANAKKRLAFFYPDKHELKTTVEPEMMMTSLKIKLEGMIRNAHELNPVQEQENDATF